MIAIAYQFMLDSGDFHRRQKLGADAVLAS